MRRLAGRVVATTRDGAPDDPLTRLLEKEGARVLEWPTLRFGPPANAARLEWARASVHEGAFDWVVVTSARAVPSLGSGEDAPARVRVGAVGSATGAALREAGWRVDVCGEGGAADLAAAMQREYRLAGARVLFPAASLAGDVVEEALTGMGARVERVEAYQTLQAPPDAVRVTSDLAAGVDVVTFASPSAVTSLAEAMGPSWPEGFSNVAVAAIGRSTERAIIHSGLEPERVTTADPPSLEGLVQACATSIEAMKRKEP